MTRRKGMLLIPSLKIDVPIYEGDNAQQIVDAENSAAFFRMGLQDCIADHCHQEDFSRLAGSIPNKTVAWVVTPAKTTEYICFRSEIGRIVTDATGHHLRDADMQPVYKQNPGGLCIYTCTGKTADKITFVYLTYWKPLANIDVPGKYTYEETDIPIETEKEPEEEEEL